ncbi:MAG: class A beta-lactamase-related serine hydrolase [candidate division SR1 bacterium]|nr:class A beta-lactamase-related serine hydrolase [candidate division SR1 bacterium]
MNILSKNKKWCCYIAAAFVIAFIISWIISRSGCPLAKALREYGLLNPIIKYHEGEDIMKEKEIDFKSIIEDYVNIKLKRGDTEHVSVYYRALNNGDRIGINENEYFSPASLMKLPIMIAYLKKAEEDKGFLDKSVIYDASKEYDPYTQDMKPAKALENGKTYTFRELIERMITYSDNAASLMLQENIDIKYIENTFYDLGMGFPASSGTSFDNNIPVKDYSVFFRVLFNSSYLNQKDSEWALTLLNNTEFDEGIKAGLPSNRQFAHKFGERGIIGANGKDQKQLHDCGIVYYPEHPYILCIMTRGYDRDKLKAILKDISETIYTKIRSVYTK